MAELADALDSGSSSRKAVEVQVLSTAPYEIISGYKATFVFSELSLGTEFSHD